MTNENYGPEGVSTDDKLKMITGSIRVSKFLRGLIEEGIDATMVAAMCLHAASAAYSVVYENTPEEFKEEVAEEIIEIYAAAYSSMKESLKDSLPKTQ